MRALLRAVMYVVALVAGVDTYLLGSRYLVERRSVPSDRAQVIAGVVAVVVVLGMATVPAAVYRRRMRRVMARRRGGPASLTPPAPQPSDEVEPSRIVVPPALSDQVIDESRRKVDQAVRAFGPDHPTTFAAKRDLAAAYWATGHLTAATSMYESVLADCHRVLGPNHPDTLTCRSDLAAAYEMDGRLDEAISLYAHTLAIRERVLGPQHPDTLSSRSSLAVAYSVRDNLSRGRGE